MGADVCNCSYCNSDGEELTDAELGMTWWNRLTEAERAMWLDRAWKRASPPGEYTLETMPSAADAWAEFKRGADRLPDDQHGQ